MQAHMKRYGFRRWGISGTLPCGTKFDCGGSSPEYTFELFVQLYNRALAKAPQAKKSDD